MNTMYREMILNSEDFSRGDKNKPEFIFPISVELTDGSPKDIADKEALRAYLDALDEGVKPVFVFPLSILVNGKTI